MSGNVISVVAALIRDEDGRVLLVRKRGTAVFMQPGGKRDPGESDIAALARELVEELGCRAAESSARPLGVSNVPQRMNRITGCVRPCMPLTSRGRSYRVLKLIRWCGSIRARCPTCLWHR